MITYENFDKGTQIAERVVRLVQGMCLLAALGKKSPFKVGGRSVTFEQLGQVAFHGRICIYALDLMKDAYQTARGETFKDLRAGNPLSLSNLQDFSGIMVDISVFSLFLTDTLGLIPVNRVTQLLEDLCDPLLVTYYILALRKQEGGERGRESATKTALDIIHALAPYLLARWKEPIAPVTLIASGLYGLYAARPS